MFDVHMFDEEMIEVDEPGGPDIFSLICEGSHTASELVANGKYCWWNTGITDEQFPLQQHTSVSRTIELVGFNYTPTCEEVDAEFSRRGLDRPTYEDALYFGIQHPEVQVRCPIVFLHEPIQCPDGICRVLVLDDVDVLVGGKRSLHFTAHWFQYRKGPGWDLMLTAVRKS